MQETGNKSNNPYSLSIRFYTDGFSFFICNPQSEKNFIRKDFPVTTSNTLHSTLSQAIKEYPPLQERKYTIVSALFNSPVSRVPLEFFHKDHRKMLYELPCRLLPEHRVHYNILPHLEIAELFTIPQNIEQILLKQFPAIHFYAQNAMVLERTVQQCPSDNVQTLYVYFYAQRVFIFHYQNKKIRFANEFAIVTVSDALYYILNVWKRLELNQENDRCILIQPENAPENITTQLSQYLRHITVADMKEWFGQAPLSRIKNIPFDILSLLLNGF